VIRFKITLKNLIIYSFCFYITTIFLFVHDEKLVIISELAFLTFTGLTLIRILKTKTIKLDKVYIPVLLLLFIALLSTLWAVNVDIAVIRNKTLFQMIILFFIIYNIIDNEEDIKLILEAMVLGGLGMSIYAVYFYGIDNILNSFNENYRIGQELIQANIFGYYATITFLLMMYLFIFKNKKIYLIVGILPLVFSITSGSRRSLLVLLMGTALLILLNNYVKRNKMGNVFFVIIAIVFVPILIELTSYLDTLSRLQSSFEFIKGSRDMDKSLLTRSKMISFGWDLFTRRPFLGYGTDQYRVMYNYYFGGLRPAHNGYIQVIVEMGMIGFILYYGMIIYAIKKILKYTKNHKSDVGSILIVLLICHLISDLATSSIYDKLTYIYLSLAFGFIRVKRKTN
jgi:O-antigen ligase